MNLPDAWDLLSGRQNSATWPSRSRTFSRSAARPRCGSIQSACKPIATRRCFSGRHRIGLLVNGRVAAEASFELRA
jgi:hypothetical protein